MDTPIVRLVKGPELPPNSRYATLSHCWGNVRSSVLTRDTLPTFFRAIPQDALSQTAKDAIHVARALRIRYLWIDGFCIIQRDKEDWRAQSAQMAKVYGLSACTIAAAASDRGDQSFLCSRNQYAIRPCEVLNPFSTEANMAFQISARSLKTIFDEEVKLTSWHNRGWVFQERLLSQRLLIFGTTQMMWSCQRLSAAESWPVGRTSKHHIDRFESFEAEKLELHVLLDPERLGSERDEVWHSVVERYTRAEMRVSSDRLIALEGIASRVVEATRRSYSFGLWLDNTLPEALLWHASTARIGPVRTIPGVPTWSWASVAYPVDFIHDQTVRAEVYIMLDTDDPENTVIRRKTDIKIRGPLFEMTMTLNSSRKNFELRRDEVFEMRRRNSLHPAALGALHYDEESAQEAGRSLKVRLRELVHRTRIKVRA